MATISKSANQKSANQKSMNQATNNNAISGTTLSCWSRQQKLAMATIAGFAILGLLLAMSACSKESPKPALAGVSGPAPISATLAAAATPATAPTTAALPAPAKKTRKKHPANVTYSDPYSGVSFLYPRKFALTSGDKAQPELGGLGDVPMNFVQPGGVEIATVALPDRSYPGTDFASAFFNVNVNRSVSEQECAHFAFVGTSTADGEPVDAEKVKIGLTEMEMTSNFSASATAQAETQYYHSYENGACYEYVLGLGTEGFATEGGVEHVNRDEVFAKLERILATVKINPVEPEHVAEQAVSGIAGGKE
ncbi:MAG: hypothetical protein ABSG08_08730 [Terriglobales bacterium]|jgi:hypothetical protein